MNEDLNLRIRGQNQTGRAFSSLHGDLRRTNTLMGATEARVAAFGRGLSSAVNIMRVGFAGIGVGVAAGAFQNLVSSAAELGNVADKVGIGVEALQKLRAAAELTGVSAGTLDMAMQRFSRRVGEAANGGGELVGVLEQYNIEVRDANGNVRDQVAILLDVANAIEGATSQQERLRIAFKAFDSEGAALVNTLKDGAEGLLRTMSAMDVLAEAGVRAAQETDEAWQTAWRNFTTNAQNAILGALSWYDELAAVMTPDWVKRRQGLPRALGEITTLIGAGSPQGDVNSWLDSFYARDTNLGSVGNHADLLSAFGVSPVSASGSGGSAVLPALTAQLGVQTGITEEMRRQQELQDRITAGVSSFVADLRSGLGVAEAMGNALGRIGDMFLDLAINSLVGAMFGGGLGGLFGGAGGFVPSGLNTTSPLLPGFAAGGSFRVGGSGGADSQVVAFRASPDEMVSISRPGQRPGGGGLTRVVVELGEGLEARIKSGAVAESVDIVRRGMPAAIRAHAPSAVAAASLNRSFPRGA